MIITFTHFLNERKQLGIIYHFTTFDNLIGILKSNSLISGYHYISFTRNRLFDDGKFDLNVRIVFDGDRLSDKYKIEPFLYDDKFKDEHGIPRFKKEAEERIISGIEKSYDGGIYPYELKNIKKYIIRIDIIENRYLIFFKEKFDKMIEENPEIEFKLINSYKRLT